jgi:hypothetical protein
MHHHENTKKRNNGKLIKPIDTGHARSRKAISQVPRALEAPATQYSGVCLPESLSVSQHSLKVRNVGSPPGKDSDMALRVWAWPCQKL